MATTTEEFKVGDRVEYAGSITGEAVILALDRLIGSAAVGPSRDKPIWIGLMRLGDLRRLGMSSAGAEKKAGDILRLVEVSKLTAVPVPGSSRNTYEVQLKGKALFHQFGVGYEEFEHGPGNFTTAIVEWPDGQIESVPAQYVKFLQPST